MSLTDLSLRLDDLGRREEALTASAEATGTYRELAASADRTVAAVSSRSGTAPMMPMSG
jgi:hypothetical protein